jgi:outer membrane receptor for ferrienterochelin and colicin
MNRKIFYLCILFLGICIITPVSAQISGGKISGTVIDADTKEPLIGVNVTITGTNMGAPTGLDGSFVVLNVPPGVYDIKAGYIGYRVSVLTGVRIIAGVTKEVNFSLSPTAVEMGEVTIEAEKVFFEAKATNTVKVLDAEAIHSLPIRGIGQALALQAGVVMTEGSGGATGNPTLYIRGGRGAEVLYVVDGVPQNDPYTGSNYSQISQEAVAQASLQVGGFEAKYGKAGSGMMNITTKTGGNKYTASVEGVTSTFTDEYGYNIYDGTFSGPLFPSLKGQNFFVSFERGWFADAAPSAMGISFNSDTVFSRKTLPNNDGNVNRTSISTKHELPYGANLTLKLNANDRDSRGFSQLYEKNNSAHNSLTTRLNRSLSAQLNAPITSNIALTVNGGYRSIYEVSGDGIWRDQPLIEWGDPAYNKEVKTISETITTDATGIFYGHGLNNFYSKMYNQAFTFDAQLAVQAKSHLFEAGGGGEFNTLRYYYINPRMLAKTIVAQNETPLRAYRDLKPNYFGYDIFGQKETSVGQVDVIDTLGHTMKTGPKQPFAVYAYLEDTYELEDLVIKVGVRLDYFNPKTDMLRDEALPYYFGDPTSFDDADFVESPDELHISPRVGLAFPVTKTTKFHAQFGTFIQQPRLTDLYSTQFTLENLLISDNLGINTGHLTSEKTTQYELGFMQVLGDNKAGLNITMFYKNTTGLVDQTTRQFQRALGGEILRYYGPANTDFGTVRGIAFTLDIARMSYFTMSMNYTYSKAEGTGSSTSSSLVATFRNIDGEVPKVIAPLDFDQRHTGSITLGFSTGKGELGLLENTNANILATFNSGRPYTPLFQQNLVAGSSNYGNTRGYVNSAYGVGAMLVNLRVEKSFILGSIRISPYLWIENLFNAENATSVYRSTGSPYSTGFLNTPEGQAASKNSPNWMNDYHTLELNPLNFGIPRMIRLGLKMTYGS